MSFVNAVCSELTLTVKKRDATLQLLFGDGQLWGSTRTTVLSEETGVTVAAQINAQLQGGGVAVEQLEGWLLGVLAASPSLTLFFKGRHSIHLRTVMSSRVGGGLPPPPPQERIVGAKSPSIRCARIAESPPAPLEPQLSLPMKNLLVAASVVAMLCTALATLTAVTFCLGMGANAKPPEIRAIKLWMIGLSLLGLAGVGAGIFLLRAGQPGWAAGVSFVPTVIMGVIFLVAVLK